jgi:5-methylcytosine-specific restriction endonuclease McrA
VTAAERLINPDAVLSRTDLRELGYERRAVDAIFRACSVVVLPGYSRPLIRVVDYAAFLERCTPRRKNPRPLTPDARKDDIMATRLCWCARPLPCSLHPRIRRARRNPLKNTAAWQRARQEVLYRDGRRCQRCGSAATPFDPLHVHHVVPRSEGGNDAPGNLVTLCAMCHPQVERLAALAPALGAEITSQGDLPQIRSSPARSTH